MSWCFTTFRGLGLCVLTVVSVFGWVQDGLCLGFQPRPFFFCTLLQPHCPICCLPGLSLPTCSGSSGLPSSLSGRLLPRYAADPLVTLYEYSLWPSFISLPCTSSDVLRISVLAAAWLSSPYSSLPPSHAFCGICDLSSPCLDRETWFCSCCMWL